MLLLQELLAIHEAPEVPVELKDVIEAFPKHHGKALEKLWGGRKLVWHGDRFFDHNELGDAYQKSLDAAEEFINDGYEAEVHMHVNAEQLVASHDDGEDEDNEQAPGSADLSFQAGLGDGDGGSRQECYLGYDPVKDKLYIGFDAWTSEDTFNEEFDKAFEEATGEEYDGDNEGHQEVFNAAWEEYKNEHLGFWGLVFEITHSGDTYQAEEAFPPMAGGFYKGMYNLFKRNHKNVIDLRLD